jgi:hypothetical protein
MSTKCVLCICLLITGYFVKLQIQTINSLSMDKENTFGNKAVCLRLSEFKFFYILITAFVFQKVHFTNGI